MAKNIVFVLHGIGQYTEGWMSLESCAVPMLKAVTKDYPFFEGKSLDTFTDFTPILYDDVFDRILAHWTSLAEGLRGAIPIMPAFADKVIGFMEEAGDDKWTLKSGADVALYWGFRLFQQRVVLRVLAQICSKVAATIAASDQVPHYHILAHSMGTAVAHDALHHLGTESWLSALRDATFDDADADHAEGDRSAFLANLERLKDATRKHEPFSPTNFAFQSITMLSNVSGLIHGAESPYHSIVRPGTPGDEGAVTNNYLNVNHQFDPVSIIGDFRMPEGWSLSGGGFDILVDHLVGEPDQLHDAAHYVRHPDVHLRLLSQYVDQYFPTTNDIKQIASFNRKHGLRTLDDNVKDALEALSRGESGPAKDLINRLRALKINMDGGEQ
jgi:hypothetical protein